VELLRQAANKDADLVQEQTRSCLSAAGGE
jgi:hypothetical protein